MARSVTEILLTTGLARAMVPRLKDVASDFTSILQPSVG